MTGEQQRTLSYLTERYNRQVMLYANGLVKTTKDWHRYQEVVRDFYGYRTWLDAHVPNWQAA